MTRPANATPPTGLAVIFDDTCELCRRCRSWLSGQAPLVPMRFLAASDPAVTEWSAGRIPTGAELVVVADDGTTWVGPDAFVMCLWALRDHRKLAARLRRPGMRPIAERFFHSVSSGRGLVSGVLPTSQPSFQSCRRD